MGFRETSVVRSASTIANELLTIAMDEGETLTPMQVLKLVYICHGWMLGLHGEPLIRDRIEAWKYGPVIPALYHCIKQYRDQPVEGLISVTEHEELDEIESDLVRQVYDAYGHLSGVQLSALTHQHGTPWHKTYHAQSWGQSISNDLIDDHYKDLARRYAASKQ